MKDCYVAPAQHTVITPAFCEEDFQGPASASTSGPQTFGRRACCAWVRI